MAIGGPIITLLGGVVAAPNLSALYTGEPNRGALVISAMVAVLGFLIMLAGYIMILVAVYRALVKIDALPLRPQARAASAQTTEAPRYNY